MKRLNLSVLLMAVPLCLFSSCASITSKFVSKTVSGVHPANVDLNGAKSITVMPFLVDSKTVLADKEDEAVAIQAARYIRECLISELEQSKTLKYKTSGADVVISGRISQFLIETECLSKDSYMRSVVALVEYDIINSKGGTNIAHNSTSISAESKPVLSEKRLPQSYELIESKLPLISTAILQDVQPYTVVNRISLLKNNKRAMKKAYKLFEKGEYSASKKAYLDIYENSNLFDAGYNAVRLMQIKSELNAAKELAVELFESTKDTRAAALIHEIENQQKLKTE